MAVQKLTGAPEGADHDRPTAPLPAAAVEALAPAARTEAAALSRLAAARYDAAAVDAAGRGDDARAAELSARAEQNRVAAAADDEAVAPTPLEIADRYRVTDEHRRELATHADTLCGSDFDRMLCDIDELGHCRTVLAEAGRLDLIGAA